MPGINMMPSGSTLQIPLDACTGFSAKAGNAQVTLTWTDPKDKYATPEGETAQDPDQLVSVWEYTQIIRKTGSQPTGPHDGELVVSSSVRDQYATTGFVDDGLTNDILYYYAAFAYNTDGVASEGAFTSATPIAGTPVGQLAIGTLIKILENGAPVEYLVVNQGNPSPSMYDASCDGCWVLRKDIAENRVWDSSNNDYKNSDIQAYLNGAWTSRYSAGVLSQIKQVKIPYVNGTGSGGSVASGANGLSCKIFLLSGYEVGFSTSDNSYFPRDGAKLSYFSSGTKRIADYNGSAASWWLRSPGTNSANYVWGVLFDGNYFWDYNVTCGVRPALILPSTALVDQDLNLIETAVPHKEALCTKFSPTKTSCWAMFPSPTTSKKLPPALSPVPL